jgi:hypothetical protein
MKDTKDKLEKEYKKQEKLNKKLTQNQTDGVTQLSMKKKASVSL